ncbi:hypothetical protein KP79_PYT16286 [Mizuhopecten yessoensis]|uniref:Uncharacterized protein n=1 Tax=Mizuhopecten yessoensis TaxID=6573 RepID=A0A210QHN0_MIZYE|nr:hypothetical protein KP79_PYT16286 [Mizuhopecten yessoensis]
MEDEQLRQIAQLLVKNVIEKAVDKVKTEERETDEGLDQGVDDIVGLTIGRSIIAIREGRSSPADNKMEGLAGQLDKEVDDIVGLTIGRSITAIRKDYKPTEHKIGHVTTTDAQRDKKEAMGINAATAGGSTNTSVGGKKKSSSKAHNKRDWVRKHLLCCFVRQTATVEPLFD